MRRSRDELITAWSTSLFVGVLAAAVASVGVVGADLPWLVPVGSVVASGRLPTAIAAAAAQSSGWHDALAGAQLVVFGAYDHLGARGFLVLQVIGAAVGFGALADGLRRQSASGAAVAVSSLVLIGAASTVLVARASLFSLALFPLLVLLIENDRLHPSRRLWLVVPLIAVWANLHGMVLVGVGVLAVYLALDRARRGPLLAALVLGSSVLALFATPQLWRTPRYYVGVFDNVAAVRHVGLWAPLGLHVFDALCVLVALMLLLAARARLHLWEWVACIALAVETVRIARAGFFLLVVLAYPAARALKVRTPVPAVLASAAGGLVVVAAALTLFSQPASGTSLARQAAATHRVVLADPRLGEWVELYGGRVWVGNPIDAFRRRDQRLYLDWVAGDASGAAAVSHARLVLVENSSAAGRTAARDPRLRRVAARDGSTLYRVLR